MPPRRSHPKSRLGCKQCKLRRVKCDESHPVCSNCDKRGSQCTYLEPGSPIKLAGPAAKHARPRLPQLDHGPDAYLVRPKSATYELTLMHHWTLTTHKTLGKGEADYERLRTTCTRMALSQTFLLNSLFSLTALHMAFLEPANALEYGDLAVAYQGHALAQFREILFNPTAEQCPALFWSSVMIGITAFALPRIHPSSVNSDPVHTLINLSRLLSGCGVVIKMSKELMGEERWSAHFPENPEPRRSELGLDTGRALERLKSLAVHADAAEPTGAQEEGMYVKSVRLLREHFEIADSDPSQILAWPVSVGTAFTAHLEQQDVLAQLITMCFGAMLMVLENRWWAVGSGKHLVQRLSRRIYSEKPQWSDIADWANERVGTRSDREPEST